MRSPHFTAALLIGALVPLVLPPNGVRAQTLSTAAPDLSPAVEWRVSAGYESFAFRDIAKSSPPVDGSPVVWRGSGPTVTIDYDRARPFRLHRFEMTATSNGRFTYDTGVDVTSRPADDSASFIAGRYDYRRYLTRKIVIAGLHAGVGVRGGGERRVLRHQYAGDVGVTETDVAGTVAFVAALRFRRSERFSVDAEWANGATLARGRQHHAPDLVEDKTSGGGGWLTDIAERVEVRLTSRTALLFSAGSGAEGLLFDHHAYSAERRRFMLGVTYAR